MVNIDWMEVAKIAIAAVIGTGGAIWLIPRYFLDVRLEKIKRDLQAQHQRDQAALQASLSVFGATHSAAHERRLRAVEAVWKGVRALREGIFTAVNLLDMMPVDLAKELVRNPAGEMVALLKEITTNNIVRRYLPNDSVVEDARPFMSSELWALFFGYRSFVGSPAAFLLDEVPDEQKWGWAEDPQMAKLANTMFPEGKGEELLKAKAFRLQQLLNATEELIIAESIRIVSGQTASEESAEQAQRIVHSALALQDRVRGQDLQRTNT